jgi:hypothetical protein
LIPNIVARLFQNTILFTTIVGDALSRKSDERLTRKQNRDLESYFESLGERNYKLMNFATLFGISVNRSFV